MEAEALPQQTQRAATRPSHLGRDRLVDIHLWVVRPEELE